MTLVAITTDNPEAYQFTLEDDARTVEVRVSFVGGGSHYGAHAFDVGTDELVYDTVNFEYVGRDDDLSRHRALWALASVAEAAIKAA